MKFSQILIIIIALLSLVSCRPDRGDDDFANPEDLDIVDINEIDMPDNPTFPDNPSNPVTGSMEELGRLLFWDPILSGENDVACATCHHPNFGYADGRALPIGVGGVGLGPTRQDAGPNQIGLVNRNSPTILNTAFNGMKNNGNFDPENAPMFWDNRANSLEEQALGPLESFEEMRGHAFDADVAVETILQRLRSNDQYQTLFANAFGNTNAINSVNLAHAIATFERSIVATNSPFDDFMAGDQNAMTQAQIRGLNEFQRIGCDDCHSGPMFSDFELHVVGVPDHNLLAESDSGANGTYAFRTPTLRNLGFTGPYFHNGVGQNLRQTIQFYRTVSGGGGGGGNGGGGNGGLNINNNLDRNDLDNDVRNLNNFNNNDIDDIVAFIQALNDPDFDRTIPASVPSGLNPGGNID